MARVLALPARGAVLEDARGGDRALRVTWHHEVATVVLSLWRDEACVGTFRLAAEDVPALMTALSTGLAAGYGARAGRAAG